MKNSLAIFVSFLKRSFTDSTASAASSAASSTTLTPGTSVCMDQWTLSNLSNQASRGTNTNYAIACQGVQSMTRPKEAGNRVMSARARLQDGRMHRASLPRYYGGLIQKAPVVAQPSAVLLLGDGCRGGRRPSHFSQWSTLPGNN